MENAELRESPLRASWRRFRRTVPGFVKGVFRRQSEILLPNREAREYRIWMARRLGQRRSIHNEPLEPGLLSVLTPVWNGSPVQYLKKLAESLIIQNPKGATEWVILDNGCMKSSLIAYLQDLSSYSWVKLHRFPTNLGIIKGLRSCLAHASARYVLPVDADDYLHPDALQVITSCIHRAGYPPLLYTDEDKVIGNKFFEPYFKPDWDPVLLLNSAYIAHLGIIDREKALELGAYTDEKTEASPDWDLFIRFMIAAYDAVHIPEVLYSWRAHAHSTADDAATKPYVHSSQKAVLQRYLDAQRDLADKFTIEYNPFLAGAAHFYFRRKHEHPRTIVSMVLCDGSGGVYGTDARIDYPGIKRLEISVHSDPPLLAALVRELAEQDGFVHFIGQDVQIDNPEWPWEALGIFELHPDTVCIGGRIRNNASLITEAGRYFGFGGVCGCPNRGRSALDPGYFAQMWKRRSVSAASTQFAVFKARFLLDLLNILPKEASLPFLGAWAGAHALRTGKRVVYSPFLSGVSETDWDTLVPASERNLFARMNQDIIPDRRFYPCHLSLRKPFSLAQSEPERSIELPEPSATPCSSK